MRFPLSSLATLALAVGLATCAEGPNVPVKQTAGRGQFSLRPVWSPAAAAVYATRATFAAVDFDHVRIVLVRPPDQVVKDTTITFNASSPPATIEIFVDVRADGEVFNGRMDYTNNGVVVFRGEVKLTSHPVDSPAPPAQNIVIAYVGPGANATRIVVSPKTSNVIAPATVSMTATALDDAGAAVANVPLNWTTSDATIASVNANTGLVTAGTRRGTATITAMTPTGRSDNGTVTVALPPAAIAVVSGSGQTGKAGAALAQPGVVRVTASDGVGVAGVTVNFAAPTGGSVGSASVLTNADGVASSSLTLGGTVGPQSFAASAAGFSTSITATATAGDASTIAVASGNGQQDTVRRALRAPFVVRVTDRFGNGVGGVTVNWSRTSGSGTLGGATSVSNGDGLASMTYTLGGTVGAETVTATTSGGTGSAIFTATAVSAAAANITIVSGSPQTGRVTQALAAPFIVRVTDVDGNPVAGAPVNWAATNGTIPPGTTTNAQGESSNTLTAGATVGTASATATIGSGATAKSVTFTANISAGVVARLAITVQPSNTAAGSPITPGVRVELQDAAGNRTAAANGVTIALGANPGEGTLGGTRTRTSSGGVVVFDDLTINSAGTGYTLVVTSAGVPNVTSAAFNVTQATSRMQWIDAETSDPIEGTPDPVYMTAGQSPSGAPVIRITNNDGQPIAGAAITYSVSRAGQTLFGGSATAGESGRITFAALNISPANLQVAGNYVFTATRAGAAGSPLTLPVIVQPAAPARYVLTAPTTTPATGSQTVITAAFADQFNNPIPTPTPNTVSWTLSGTGGGTLTPANSNTNTAGQAQATYTAPAAANGSVTISAIDLQYTGVTGQITLTPQGAPQPPALISIVSAPASFVNGVLWSQQPVVRLVDNALQPVAMAGVTVTLEVLSYNEDGPPPGGFRARPLTRSTSQRQRDVPVANATAVTNSSGIATFTGVVATGQIEDVVLQFSATISGVGTIVGFYNDIVMNPGAAANFAILAGENQIGQTSVALPALPSVQLVDISGNATVSPSVSVSFTPGSGSGSATPSLVPTDAEGIAKTTWSMPATTGAMTLVASATIGGTPRSITFHATSVSAIPAFVEPVSPIVTTTPVGTPLGASAVPIVRVRDGIEAPLPNTQVTFTPYGACSIAGAPLTVMTNANGEASVPVGSFSFTVGAAGSCRVLAQPVLGSGYAQMSYIATPTGQTTWTGANSNDWTDAGNWVPAAVPASEGRVYIPSYPLNDPRLTTNAAVGDLTMEGVGGGFNILSNTLTVNGNLDGGPTPALSSSGAGVVVLNALGPATVTGFIGAQIRFGPDQASCSGGSYSVTGVVQTFSARLNCPVTLVGNATYSVAGSFVVQNQGRLIMNAAGTTPTLSTSSDVTFQGLSHDGYLTRGTIFVGATLNLVNNGSAIPFAQGTAATLIMGGAGTRFINIGANVSTVNLGSFQLAPNNNVTINSSGVPINVAGTFQTFGSMTIGATGSMTVAGNAHFATSSSTNILGTMGLGASATTLFSASSTVNGTGVLTVPNVSGCSRSATASVNVTGGTAYTAAVPAQCANSIP